MFHKVEVFLIFAIPLSTSLFTESWQIILYILGHSVHTDELTN